jgi:hypothetical protein
LVSGFLYLTSHEKLEYFIPQWSLCIITIVVSIILFRMGFVEEKEGVEISSQSRYATKLKTIFFVYLMLETTGRILSISLVLVSTKSLESSVSHFVWIHFLWSVGSGVAVWVVMMGVGCYALVVWFSKCVISPRPDGSDRAVYIVQVPAKAAPESFVLTHGSVRNHPGSLIEKLSIQTSVFESQVEGTRETPVHVPFGSPIPPLPTENHPIPSLGSISDASISQDPNDEITPEVPRRVNTSDASLAYSDWNGDHRWETYRIIPVERLQVRGISPLRLGFDEKQDTTEM